MKYEIFKILDLKIGNELTMSECKELCIKYKIGAEEFYKIIYDWSKIKGVKVTEI